MRLYRKLLRFMQRLPIHLRFFWAPWILFAFMFIVALFLGGSAKTILLVASMFLFVGALLLKPMNIIHGLIGTRGDIQIFFIIFLMLNFLFANIYYFSFFKDAGITYDLNQPHVEFSMFKDNKASARTVCPEDKMENIPESCSDTCHYYHRIRFVWVLQNTFLTSLMQEPTEFYSTASIYNGNHIKDDNYNMASSFHWFLVFHIMISWILLGVFISLIYQKFRNS